MGQIHIGKKIVVCLLICFMASYTIIEYQIIVKAQSDNDLVVVDTESTDTEINKAAEVKTIGWTDIKSVLSSIFIEMLGAFLGFLSAIVLTHRSNKKQMKELDISLLGELRAVYEELGERLQKGFEDYYRYQTPIWDINLESGTLALVSSSKVYNKYIQIYSKIQYAQELESEYVHTKLFKHPNETDDFVERYIDTIDNARKREAENIHNYIEKNIIEESGNARRKSINYNR